MKTAVYTGTKNLYPHMIPAIKSLLFNSDVDIIYLLIEDDVFPFQIPDNVISINVSNQQYFRSDGPNMVSRYTYLAMMRAALAKVFPNIDTILSLDVDTIVNQDISDLWNLPIDNYYFSAAREPLKSSGGKWFVCDLYTNTGVALYNLKKLREDKKVDEIIYKLNHTFYDFVEQDCFNLCCQNNILIMSSDYNVNNWVDPYKEKKIIHYAAVPLYQWQHQPTVQKYRNLTWKEIASKRGKIKNEISINK